MEYKTIQLARLAKELGYTHIATVVKSVFNTNYYNVNSCDDVISAGRWIGAFRSHQFSGQRMGTIGSAVDWTTTITREELRRKLQEN